jgi:ribosomal protein S18
MARNSKPTKKSQGRRPRPASAGGRPRRGRPKVCVFCSEHATWVDYKDVSLLRRFMNDRGRIKARGATGTCAQHQRDVAVAIKTARELALLPYAVRPTGTETRGGRGGDRRGNGPPVPTAATPEDAEPESSPQVTPQTGEGQSAVADQVPDSPVAASA